MSIRQYKKNGVTVPNTWTIDYYPEGRKGERVQRIVSDVSEGQARLIEKGLRRQRKGTAGLVNPSISKVLPDWLHWMQLHRAPKTVESIGWALKHLEPHFGQLQVNQITEVTFNQYKSKRRKAPRGCNLEMDYIKSMISWMVERKLCDPLPFKVERLPYNRPLPKIPTPEAMSKWLTEVNDPQKRAMVDLMLYAGLRFKEVTHLDWKQVDLISRNISLVNTKGDRPRISVLPESVANYLKTIGKKDRKGLAFPSPRTGREYNNMKNLFKGASTRSGVDIKGPHTLRHICGTYTLATTGNLRMVQTTLGHTQIRTTELYTQIEIGGMRDSQQQLENYIDAPAITKKAKQDKKRKAG